MRAGGLGGRVLSRRAARIMKQQIFIGTLALGLVACSAHSPFIVANTTDVKPAAAQHYPAHSRKVLMVSGPLPANVKYELIGDIEIGKVWYGGSAKVLQELAERARELGADAVIDAKTWHQPSGYSWAAPHGSGKAVKILNAEEIRDFSALGKML